MPAASPAGGVTGSRQEVFEPIGLGQSPRSEQSRRGAPPGESPRPLARETSAGVALIVRKGRKAPMDVKGRGHLINCTGGLRLHRRARNREATLDGADRGSDDPAVVLADGLVAEVDERRLACAHGRWSSLVRTRVHRVRARGERAPEAGSRRQSRENGDGLLVIPCASGVEGALVDGRHPGVWTASPLTRGRWKRAWLPGTARLRSRGGGARHRVSEATSRARHAVENTAAGRRRSEGPSIAAPARNERCPSVQHALGPRPSWGSMGGRDNAEAGGSPSSEAPLEIPQVAPAAGGCALTGGPQGSKEARSRIDPSVGCSCRESVAEVGEAHLPRRPTWVGRETCPDGAR
jgi:hypothetical protein